MSRPTDIALTALAPIVWGSSYFVSTEFLPGAPPLTVAALRALPAGLLLLAVTRQLPGRDWLGRVAVLGLLNFALFWSALFIAAYRLPGGVAATLGAVQPLVVLLLAALWLGTPLRLASVLTALAGLFGVGMLILGPEARLDPVGISAALLGALSMAAGTVLSRRWQPPVPPLSFAAWQLTAGGVLLVPLALIIDPRLPQMDAAALGGLLWLGLVGGALTYWVFFRGIAKLGPAAVAGLGFLSPLSAVGLGWAVLGQGLSPLQATGAVLVLGSVWLGQKAAAPGPKKFRTKFLGRA
ncbi:EamA family transporter [Salipiger abyssi]|uniref:EamA family transporter n=1 Tax=Salipiger abyssi TaxID=1250539 RepID=UPI001A8FBB04|nr:EamA family transporter [Salipiger abyssi]MBN9889218.1 EamA family transporter [Salipiger abyssi]